MKKIWLIENKTLAEDDDHRVIFTHDADWQTIYEDYELIGTYIDEDEQPTHIFRMGWLASFASDCQTFGFILAAFILNYQFAGADGWLSFLLFLMALVFVFGKVASKSKAGKHVQRFKKIDDAIEYLKSLK